MTALEQEDIRIIACLPYNWNRLKGKTVLISGGTGFLGDFLIRVIQYRNQNFNNQIKVFCLSRKLHHDKDNVYYIKKDLSHYCNINVSADIVLHLASNTHPKQYVTDPVGTILTNIIGCKTLLDYCRDTKVERFFFASSVEIYGDGEGLPMQENFCGRLNCINARTGYNEAKRLCECLCQAYRMQYGTDIVIGRLARCFGADRKEDSKAMAQFFTNATKGVDIVLKSKGDQRFSYCYIADAISGILKVLLDGDSGESYNITEDDEGKTLGMYAEYIAKLAGKKVVYSDEDQLNAVSKANYAILSNEKLRFIGWKPIFTVSEGIERTMQIYKEIASTWRAE